MRLLLLLASMAAVLVPASGATAETAAEKALAQQIGRDLKESGQLRNYQIGVKYQDGVVWLGGTVANASQKRNRDPLDTADGRCGAGCQPASIPGRCCGWQQPAGAQHF